MDVYSAVFWRADRNERNAANKSVIGAVFTKSWDICCNKFLLFVTWVMLQCVLILGSPKTREPHSRSADSAVDSAERSGKFFLPVWRYASASTSYGPVILYPCLCLSVCHSQVGVVSKALICFLAWRLRSTSPTVWFSEIQVCTKIRVLPSGTFS